MLLLFHIVITFLVGAKLLDFTTHSWLMPMVISENFLQIVGMGYVVVKFFYREDASIVASNPPKPATPDGLVPPP